MVNPLILFAGDNRLEIVPEAGGWAKCYLIGDERIYLGADDLDVLASRLCEGLSDPPRQDRPALGEIDGYPVVWVLSLAEAHHVLYAARTEGTLLFFWQNAHRSPVALAGVMRLSAEQRQQWRGQLGALLVPSPTNGHGPAAAASASRELAHK